jgi:hypothetical protein
MSDPGQHAADAARASALVDELLRLQVEKARIAAAELDVYARAMELAEEQTARIASHDSAKREMPLRCLSAELATAARLHDRTVQGRMTDAVRFVRDFPATVAALGAARISQSHAYAILDAGSPIADPTARAEFEDRVVDFAATSSVGRTKAFARQLSERLNPRTMTERHRDARALRSVTVTELDDGMGQVLAITPLVLARGIGDRLTRQAKAVMDAAGAGAHDAATDDRTLDQVRADVFTDLLLTGAPAIDPLSDEMPGGLGAIRATVQVTVPVTTLTGVTAFGAELDGRAPVDPETARCLAGSVPGWDRVLVHPVTGLVLTVDRYTPSAEQKRYLRARDRHCRFPGCRMPARRCDIDHTHDAAKGGATAVCNLACFCKRHHTLKHATDWAVRQLPGGILEWTSPTGRCYTDEPPPRVLFLPDDVPDPGGVPDLDANPPPF